ncbi:MAG: hypothetical protein MUO58_22085 [Anaerolineales bacterium]|nr:hypothetical protein [Anaerolineales bacterium]HUS84513.1 hypothetical protein [Anaerolineales bacterium]
MRMPAATHRRWSNRVVAVSSIFAGLGVAHMIDDFLYGVPAEFNLSNPPTQFLAMAFFVALTGLIALAARGTRASYQGLITIGLLLALADTLKHLPEIVGSLSYRSGTASIVFSIGLIVSGLATAAVAWLALRQQGKGQSRAADD